ncbi:hypothetical protein OU798_07360 [Prolixibacteraceae bacterium Z1-6]|uniref:Uncharacterized protein n=1 Tax=Draconibacterium aestuarii TaxID=2998507 RepID=A0A9X3F412_9BACT|nr:hypothetical protein [Prolixibacteraceae bacterium Z1-6]
MAKFSNLIAYFSNLATKHKSILHSESEKHFFRMEIDEVLAGTMRSDTAYPFLALEGFSYDFTDNRSDNLVKNREGGFILLDHISDMSDFAAIHQKWDELEEIGDDLLLKIKADKRDPVISVVNNFDFNSVKATLILNEISKTVGIRYLFTINSAMSNDVDPSRWNE